MSNQHKSAAPVAVIGQHKVWAGKSSDTVSAIRALFPTRLQQAYADDPIEAKAILANTNIKVVKPHG